MIVDWETPGEDAKTKVTNNSILSKKASEAPKELKAELETAATWIVFMGIIYLLIGIAQIFGGQPDGVGAGVFYVCVAVFYFIGSFQVRFFRQLYA